MKKILIACNAGISTSMLVRDMRVVAQNKGVTSILMQKMLARQNAI